MTSGVIPLPSRERSGSIQTIGSHTAEDLYGLVWSAKDLDFEDEEMRLCLCALATKLIPGRSLINLFDALAQPKGLFRDVDLMNTLSELGFAPQSIKTSPHKLDTRLLPCLCWSKLGQPKVLSLSKFSDAFELYDPKTRARSEIDRQELKALMQARAIVFPTIETNQESNWKFSRQTRDRSWFQTQFRRFSKSIGIIVLLGFILNLTSIAAPVFILLTYDQVIGSQAADPLIFIGVGAVVVIAIEAVLRWVRSLSVAWVTSRLDYIVGVALFEKLIGLKPREIEQTLVSSQLSRIKSFEAVRDFFAGPVFTAVLELPSVIFSFLIIYLLGGSLVVATIVSAFAYVVTFALIRTRVNGAMKEAALENSRLQQFNLDMIDKLDSIRSDGLIDLWARKHGDLSARTALAQHRLYCLGVLGELTGGALAGFTALVTLWFGTQLIWDGAMSAAALIAVVMLSWRALAPFHALCAMIPQFEQARNAIQQINVFMEAPSGETDLIETIAVPELAGRVELNSVALRYDAAMGPVFMGLNLDVEAGEIVAVTGPNGSGKSSVLKLISGFQQPLLGSVRLDGFDLRQIDAQNLRKRIAYMPQSLTLFSGTIAENLRFAAPGAGDSELLSRLADAGAQSQIEDLPNGLETEVGSNARAILGDLLVHRIGLARMLLNPSKVVLIDEQPGSVLRSGFDEDLKSVLAKARGERTVIFVTHRADFLRQSTKVLSLRPGQSPRLGSPDQFLEVG